MKEKEAVEVSFPFQVEDSKQMGMRREYGSTETQRHVKMKGQRVSSTSTRTRRAKMSSSTRPPSLPPHAPELYPHLPRPLTCTP